MGREERLLPSISRFFQVLLRSAAVCTRFLTVAVRFVPFNYVLARFSRQARMYGSRFAAFKYNASRRVTVYRAGALRRIACQYDLTRRTRSGREYKKAGLCREASLGRTHGAPYRGHGYVPLRFGESSLGEWKHNNNKEQLPWSQSKLRHKSNL